MPFQEGLRTREKNEEKKSLNAWLNSPEVNARTDDDKTLLLCLYEESGVQLDPVKDVLVPSNNLDNPIPSDSHFLPSIQGFIVVSFICHVFAGWVLYSSFSSLPLFSVVLLLSTLVFYVTLVELRNCFIKQLELGNWLHTNHKKLVAVILIGIVSILGISLGSLFSKLSYPATSEKSPRVNISQPSSNGNQPSSDKKFPKNSLGRETVRKDK